MLTLEIKELIWKILVSHGANNRDRDQFIAFWPECQEFRFRGVFGFGGKIWSPTKYASARVSGYAEDRISPERLKAMNDAIATLAPACTRQTDC